MTQPGPRPLCCYNPPKVSNYAGTNMGRHLKLVIGLLLLPLAAGCATVQEGFYQKVSVDTNAPSAYCRVSQDGNGLVDAVVTPGSVWVRKDNEATLQVSCSRVGYADGDVVLDPVHPPSKDVANTARGLLIGLATAGVAVLVDGASHAENGYPEKAYVWMEKN